MDEIIDVVNEDDQVIGQELKSKCHKEKLLHRSVHIFVFKDDSFRELLLQKRSATKGINHGKLCIPGGHLSAHEIYLEGAKRELQEEMFHEQELPKELVFEELFKIRKSADNDHEFTTSYRTIASGPFTVDPVEVESCFFEDIFELLEKVIKKPETYTATTIFLLQEYLKKFMRGQRTK
jgi:isopentenyldiphosphate isomerase